MENRKRDQSVISVPAAVDVEQVPRGKVSFAEKPLAAATIESKMMHSESFGNRRRKKSLSEMKIKVV